MFENDLKNIDSFLFNEEEVKDTSFDYKKYLVPNEVIDKNLNDFLSGNFKKGLGIGLEMFDKFLLLKENQLWASCGRKGGGKTTITSINYLMWSICHSIKCAVAYQENDDWHVKFNMLSMLLGLDKKNLQDMYKDKHPLIKKSLEWINKHYFFLKVKTIKEATIATQGLINEGVNIHTLILDPANSFLSGFSDTGNKRYDDLVTAIEVLDFAMNVCSVHVSQHPIIGKQRETGDVTSYDAENGVYLNKAHGTYTINRDKGTSSNRIAIDNERTKHMGGGETHPDDPIIMEWKPTGIDLYITHNKNSYVYNDVIQTLRYKYNPLNEEFINKPETVGLKEKTELPTPSANEAFGTGEDDIPF